MFGAKVGHIVTEWVNSVPDSHNCCRSGLFPSVINYCRQDHIVIEVIG